ncbi:MAG: Hsp20/alpha crystallin family protein [Gammaproteobacteria bacterium]|nr:Hsp20/alpha crystallin family protein [Gammaproteobacteria bacterium]MDE0365225.1 Hsp20/alpha crystallin family protein [Gammaproteobacteria bacterium]
MSDKTTAKEHLAVQEKQAHDSNGEQTVEGRFFRPLTDIFENPDALTVVMEVPGVDRDDIDIQLDNNRLTVSARIGLERYGSLEPVYTEYEVGHFTRSFQLSSRIDRNRIEASVDDGVLTLSLPKTAEATPRSIAIN